MATELELIDAFLAPFGARRGDGVIGDDCAALAPSPGMRLVVTVDAVVEGVHFDLRRFKPEDAGHKALAVNLSDLAAAGARPRWFLCALGVPRGGRVATAVGFARGMARLARKFRCALVGGNVTGASEWSMTITALGEARRPLRRSGARPGDALVVVGRLGDAALGLRGSRRHLRAQLRPTPLIEAGLAAARLARASIDVSDGFLRDLGNLCSASGCGAEVECEKLPADDLEAALTGGEDYALLLAVAPEHLERLARATGGVAVGRLTRRPGIRLTWHGSARPLPARLGWDHLR